MVLPDDLSPDRLMAEVQTALGAPAPIVKLDMDGLSRISRAIASLLAPSAGNGNGSEPQEALALERMLA
jgi:predicted glycosyltransferase